MEGALIQGLLGAALVAAVVILWGWLCWQDGYREGVRRRPPEEGDYDAGYWRGFDDGRSGGR